jgi:hypothetical protein
MPLIYSKIIEQNTTQMEIDSQANQSQNEHSYDHKCIIGAIETETSVNQLIFQDRINSVANVVYPVGTLEFTDGM